MGYSGTLIEAHIPMPDDCYIVKTARFTGKMDDRGRKVWEHKSKDHPFLMTWDGEKGEIEVFDKRTLAHNGVYYPNGDRKSGAVQGRRLGI